MNADLHCHSVISDGTLEPEILAQRAHTNGVTLWALTDHDEIGGQHRACAAALGLGMSYLTGTEISVSFAGHTVHIVGLGFDADNPDLVEGLWRTRSGRQQRAREIAQGLAADANIEGTFEGALAHAGNPELISRTHFARHLVERGVCGDTHSVFRKYLTEGKPGFVPHRWAALGDAVSWITQAGGIAVIAHPARYRFTPTEEYALFTEFKAHGGQGVEVVTGSHTASEAARYANTALEFDLFASRGSDFHSPIESQTDLGKLPKLPTKVKPVWEALLDRIQAPS
jgi:3',5'-nucleoside bisphosphate phosphatase